MKAARIHNFGGPEVIVVEEVAVPVPGSGEVLVKVAATGVGPWDALIREGKSKVAPQPPLTLGSDLSGVVEAVGLGVTEFKNSDQVYGVTNPQFCGANAEYAIAIATMIALQPLGNTDIEAASVPVVAVTEMADALRLCTRGAGSNCNDFGSRWERGRVRRAVRGESRTACGRSGNKEGN